MSVPSSRGLLTSHNKGSMKWQVSAIPEEEHGEYTYTEGDAVEELAEQEYEEEEDEEEEGEQFMWKDTSENSIANLDLLN